MEVGGLHGVAVDHGGDGDVGVVGVEVGDVRLNVEQAGETVASGGGLGEVGGVVGQRDAGPADTQPSGVGLAVGGVVRRGADVMEEVIRRSVHRFDVCPRSLARVGSALDDVGFSPNWWSLR